MIGKKNFFKGKLQSILCGRVVRLMMALALLLFFSISFAFKVPKGARMGQVVDSLGNDKSSFKSLFSATYYDPSRPYVAQLNPRAIPFVENYIRIHSAYLKRMSFWGRPYFDLYDNILAQYKLPKELKYLSVIESALVPGIVSWAGAVGPWQIMEVEAKQKGLIIHRNRDDRTDFYKSTHAAAKILVELHSQFNDWTLVIAAYNCGAGRVRQAIRRSGSSNFWDLQNYLPEETRNHVKRFIATHYILEGRGGLTTMTASELAEFDLKGGGQTLSYAPDSLLYKTIAIAGKYKASVISKKLAINMPAFSKLNPNFDKALASGIAYNLTLPIDKVALFESSRNAILDESIMALLTD